jgi:hypothetical protein
LTNNLILQEELKRIGFMMNYDPKKVVSENTETTKNLIVENKIETLFTPKTSNDVISETTLKQIFKEAWETRKNLISEQWERTPPGKPKDPIGYWRVLFDQLKATGIGVKWEVPNDPVKSAFMYWGPWVINKDTNKNGGWPITFTGTNKKLWLFKFKGGKYTGGSADATILESKFINSTFNLGQWGSFTGAAAQLDNLIKTKPKSAAASNVLPCKKPDGKQIPDNQVQAEADAIFKEIAYAFDGGGTYEAEAVAAYARITCKPLLDKINAKVAARGMSGIKNVQQWLTDEMSDYDYEQYRKIWASLQKVDKSIVAPKVNQLYRGAGIVGDVTGINAIEKGAEGIQQMFSSRPIDGWEKIVNAIRDFLGGVGGAVVTTILDFTGIGKVITTIGWGLLIVGDMIVWVVKGVAKIPEIILSLISILTTGVSGAAFGKLLKPFMGSGVGIGAFLKSTANLPGFKQIGGLIQKGMAKIGSMINSAVNWFKNTSWFKKYLLNGPIGKAINAVASRITSFIDDFAKSAAGAAGSKATTAKGKELLQKQGADKIKGAVTTDFAKDLGWEGAAVAGEELGGDTGKKIAKLAKSGTGFGTGLQDLSKTQKKIDMQKAGTGYRGPLTSVSKETAKNTGSVVKSGVKSYDTSAQIAGVDANQIATDAETKRRQEAEAARKKSIADANARAKFNLPNQNKEINRDAESTNVVRQPA